MLKRVYDISSRLLSNKNDGKLEKLSALVSIDEWVEDEGTLKYEEST